MGITNSIGDFIRSVFPSTVSREGAVFKALLASPDRTGTIERIFEDVQAGRLAWQGSRSLYTQRGEQLDKTLTLISVLTRISGEEAETYRNRNELVLYRLGHKVWGTKWDVQALFRAFFNSDDVWVVSNTDDSPASLLDNGEFEGETGWELSGDCEYSPDAAFEGEAGLRVGEGGGCSQTVTLAAGRAYFLHFFLNGSVDVTVRNGQGFYWNPGAGEDGEWQEEEARIPFSTERTEKELPAGADADSDRKWWEPKSMWFRTDGAEEDDSPVTITFLWGGQDGCVDYARLFRKTKASTFSVIGRFEGFYTDTQVWWAPGRDDDIVRPPDPDWKPYGYFAPGNSDAGEVADSSESYMDTDSAAMSDDTPILAEGQDDVINTVEGYENMPYMDDTAVLSPDYPADGWDPNLRTVDYEKMSYYDNDAAHGGSGGSGDVEGLYRELLEYVKPEGVYATMEILVLTQKGHEE